jgi:predicted acetyltransferase/predicted lactoylglutathione lyase
VDDKINGQPSLLLRPLDVSDEKHARQAHRELAQDAFDFLLDLRRGEPWLGYLARLDRLRLGIEVPKGWVPATFLVAEVEGQVVGRVSVRHQLNPYLAEVAGHIGIGVRPDFRRLGHGTAIMRQSLTFAAATGLGRVLVTCDASNLGSRNVIARSGGVQENVQAAHRSEHKCRFWVETVPRAVPSRPPTPTNQITPGDHSPMEQRVSLITLGVADVRRSRSFYERLGWQGQELDETAVFRVGAIALVLRGREELALDCGLADEQAGGFSGVLLAHNVRTEAEVESVLASAERAGARVTHPAASTACGGYAGSFTDPDGHAWQVAYNPGLPLGHDGSITVPDFVSP